MKKKYKKILITTFSFLALFLVSIIGMIIFEEIKEIPSYLNTIAIVFLIISCFGMFLPLVFGLPVIITINLEKTIHRYFIKTDKWLKEGKNIDAVKVHLFTSKGKAILDNNGVTLEKEEKIIKYSDIDYIEVVNATVGQNMLCLFKLIYKENNEVKDDVAIDFTLKSLFLLRKNQVLIKDEDVLRSNFVSKVSEEEVKKYKKKLTLRDDFKKIWPLYIVPVLETIFFIATGVIFCLVGDAGLIFLDLFVALFVIPLTYNKLQAHFGFLRVTSEGVFYVNKKDVRVIGWADLKENKVVDGKMILISDELTIEYPTSQELEKIIVHYIELNKEE